MEGRYGLVVYDLAAADLNRYILMSFNNDDPLRTRLWKVNVHDGSRKIVSRGRKHIWNWSVDQQLNPRLGSGAEDTTWRIMHRAPDSKQWEVLLEYPVDSGRVFSPQLFDRDDPDLVYVVSNHEGDLSGLYSYRISKQEFVERIALDEARDIAGIITSKDGSSIAGVVFSDDDDNMLWFDSRYPAITDKARPRFPDAEISIVSASDDLSRAILYVRSNALPGRYYLYTAESDQLQYFAPTYPDLEKQPLAAIKSINYEARDGLTIPGYLTLPPGVSEKPKQPLPAIVYPHGGPHSRDYSDFDPMLQMFANRGYAVLQMNFRGSSGHGTEFQSAGYRQWGQAMQDDVTDGTQWLINQGIADPERICIVGGSYGGYDALMGAVKESNLYACSISINGVTDLRGMLHFLNNYIGGRAAAAFIGDSWRDRKHLKENSPVERADDIRAPVLIIYGDKDRTVPASQSREMARALKSANKKYKVLELEDAGHQISRGDHRLEYFSAMDRFLAKYLQAP